MLVLSRRESESVVIPQARIEIVVRAIEGDRVKLGFRAPDEVDIYRSEIWQELCFDEFSTKAKETKE